jgi:hypothetical protein
MNLTPSTHALPRHRQSLLLSCAAWILIVLTAAAVPASAQGPGKDRGESRLRIRVHIVRVTTSLEPTGNENAEKDGVLFSLPHDGFKMSESEEVRTLTPVEMQSLHPGTSGTAVLQTRTIVLP